MMMERVLFRRTTAWTCAWIWLAGCGRIDFDPMTDAAAARDVCPSDPRLQACWDFEGDLADKSGNGNYAVGTGTAFVAGRFGLALETTATSRADLVTPSLDMTQYTIDVWMRPEPAAVLGLVFDHDGHFALGVEPVDVDHVQIFCNTLGDHAGAATPSPVGRWTHVVCSDTGTRLTLHIDDVEQASVPAATFIEARPAAIGANAPPDDFAAPYVGLVDRLHIWNVALTPDELTAARAP
jgi:hypothetical protein